MRWWMHWLIGVKMINNWKAAGGKLGKLKRGIKVDLFGGVSREGLKFYESLKKKISVFTPEDF